MTGLAGVKCYFCALRPFASYVSILNGRIVPNAIGHRDGDRNGNAVIACGLAGRIDGDEGGVHRHQAVFECHLLNLAGQVRVGVVSGLTAQRLNLFASPYAGDA